MAYHEVSIRPMSPTDFLLMTKWLQDEEVLQYYGNPDDPYSYERILEKYSPRLNGEEDVPPFIVERDTDPIGFMQSYPVKKEDAKAWGLPENKTYIGIDQFIGEPRLWGKGIGTQMVKRFVVDVMIHKNPDGIVLDPEVHNMRAIRCYEKCGFKKVCKIEDGSKWLLAYWRSTQ
ncbi:GNAT family N-acetyltransferase [Pontibacillus yanchengensis]|uniref:2-aminoglycoside phosphotransferase n=1 Tax=Pontibacillus yanchengensis Y32 TaxID=1385514 RepID=A0A0A2T9S5_9BACI|nr:GNAT family N-acetyltransferase [Pontibacillus yanchengensis]KGP71168.1 2-aminoglycoside phosphotransferase [Pontibacillus yanchengensis Y32]